MHGKLGLAYAELMQEMAAKSKEGPKDEDKGFFSAFRSRHALAPSAFKRVIGKFNPMFAGYEQQDASEFLSKLLEGLGEDLNHVVEKPYTELPDSENRPDWIVANETWENHLKRERHPVTTVLTGSLHSEMVCPDSGERKVTFEPFSFLVVPLPEEVSLCVNVEIHFREQRLWPLRATVSVPPLSTVCQVLMEIANLSLSCEAIVGKETDAVSRAPGPDEVVVATWSGGMSLPQIIDDKTSVSRLREGETLLVYEVGSIEEATLDADGFKVGEAVDVLASGGYVRARKWESGSVVEVTADGSLWVHLDRYREEYMVRDLSRVRRRRPVVLTCVTRTLVPLENDDYFMNGYTQQILGKPFVVQVQPDVTTSRKLHRMVWSQIRPFFTAVPRDASGKEMSEEEYPFELRLSANQHVESLIYNNDNPIVLNGVVALMVDIAVAARKHWNDKLTQYTLTHESVKRLAEANQPDELSDCMATLSAPENVVAYSRALTRARGDFTEAEWTKTIKLWQPPPVLVLVLKRFREHPDTGRRYKLGNKVVFPIDGADFSQCVVPPSDKDEEPNADIRVNALYDLSAVVNHHGSLRGGHYTCYARSLDDPTKWLDLNDSSVSEIDPSRVVSRDAYILMYTRRDASDLDVRASFPRGQEEPADLEKIRRWVPKRAPEPPPETEEEEEEEGDADDPAVAAKRRRRRRRRAGTMGGASLGANAVARSVANWFGDSYRWWTTPSAPRFQGGYHDGAAYYQPATPAGYAY